MSRCPMSHPPLPPALKPRPRRPVPAASRTWSPPPVPVPPLADQEAAIAAELARAELV
jgi:hypothetical protein